MKKELKKLIKTNEKGFWSWLTNSGELEKDVLNQDTIKLRNFYQNSGFIQAKIAEPIVEYQEHMISIKIKIDEGPKFKVGKVSVTGDLIFPEIELMEKLNITLREIYSREVVRKDVLTITDLYSHEGYAYADILKCFQVINDCLQFLFFEMLKGRHFIPTVDNSLPDVLIGYRQTGVRQFGAFEQSH